MTGVRNYPEQWNVINNVDDAERDAFAKEYETRVYDLRPPYNALTMYLAANPERSGIAAAYPEQQLPDEGLTPQQVMRRVMTTIKDSFLKSTVTHHQTGVSLPSYARKLLIAEPELPQPAALMESSYMEPLHKLDPSMHGKIGIGYIACRKSPDGVSFAIGYANPFSGHRTEMKLDMAHAKVETIPSGTLARPIGQNSFRGQSLSVETQRSPLL